MNTTVVTTDPIEPKPQNSIEFLNELIRVLPNGLVMTEAIRHKTDDNTPGAILDFRVLANNPAARQLAGLSVDDIGRTILEIDPPLQETGLFDRYVELVQTGEPFQFEYQFRGRDLALSVSKFRDGFVASFTDITDRKRVEIELQQQADLLQTTLDASISSILAMTAIRAPGNGTQKGPIVDFRMDKANRSVERSLNRTPKELEGRTLLEMFPGNVENGFFDLYAKAADTGVSQQATLHYTDVNGFEGWFEISAVQYAPDQIVLTFMNVTESKQLEQRLRESNTSLEQFASIASHDLQEPLRKINAFSDMLLDRYSEPLGDGINLVQRMRTAAERMQSLIRALLAYSRLSKSEKVTHQPTDLNRIVADVLVDLEVVVQERRAVVEIGSLPTIIGDALQLRQVFQNLISNALKFSKPNQTPHVTVRCRQLNRGDLPPNANVAGGPHQAYYEISVADNGIGFAEDFREKIFGAFERLHVRTSQYAGTGLGLTIVRKVMDNHRGSVVADSQEGKGATFTLYFPISK